LYFFDVKKQKRKKFILKIKKIWYKIYIENNIKMH